MDNNKKRIMYNERVKKEYIDYAIKISECQEIEKYEKGIFNRFVRSEKFESQIGKDICEMNTLEAKLFLTEFLSGGKRYQDATLSTLKTYVTWAQENNFTSNKENCFMGIKSEDIDVSSSYTDSMVKDENDLVKSLEDVLDKIKYNTADNVRWCIFLLIFAGISFKDLFFLKKNDVDLENKILQYNTQTINISDTFTEVIGHYFEMNELLKIGKGNVEYAKPIIDEGYLISNTQKYGQNRDKMRKFYSFNLSEVFSDCSKKLSPTSIHDSGVFYRMYLQEQQTGEFNCLEYLRARKHQSSVINYPERIKKICIQEYETWKRAFNL